MQSTQSSDDSPTQIKPIGITLKREQTAKRNREYRARQKAAGTPKSGGKRQYGSRSKGFHGFDGEGMDYEGSHALYTLRAGDLELYNEGKALTSQQMLTWIANLPHKTYVGFSLGYDFTMILRELAPLTYRSGTSFIKRLLGDREDWTDYEKEFGIRVPGLPGIAIKYVPRKSLCVTNYNPVNGNKLKKVRISDTFGFFQESFLSALTSWKVGTRKELAIIRSGKSGRGNFTGTIEERQYNALECVLLEQLMDKFKKACDDANMTPAIWEGAGWLATRMYQLHKTPTRKDNIIPEEIAPIADLAYYGGRFEVLRYGRITGPIYDYDINSAYPSNMANLPCLLRDHGYWSQEGGSTWTLHSVSWRPKEGFSPTLGPLPVRLKSGTIVFPLSSAPGAKDWYWSYEIAEAYPFNFTIHESRSYTQTCDCKPFGWVPDQYLERLRIQKEHGRQAAVAPKLGLNSLYGKAAQKIGERPYFNIVYAGIITSMCRAQILKIAYEIPNSAHVIMIATDGIFTSTEVPSIAIRIIKDKPLGDWDVTKFRNGLVIVQPGLYWEPVSDPDGLTKSRGISAKVIAKHRVEAEKVWDDHRAQDVPNLAFDVTIPSMFNSLEVSLARNKPDHIGQWDTNVKRTYNYSVGEKRIAAFYLPDGSIVAEALDTAGPTIRSKDSNYEEYDKAQLDADNIHDSELQLEDFS